MASFRDNSGREWHLEFTIPSARRIRKLLGVDVLNFEDCLPRLSADPILLCDVLFLLVEEQAARLGVTDEQFGESLAGEALESACDAFVESLIHFFPPRRREVLKAMQQAAATLEQTLTGLAETKIPLALQQIQSLVSGSKSPNSAASLDTSPQDH